MQPAARRRTHPSPNQPPYASTGASYAPAPGTSYAPASGTSRYAAAGPSYPAYAPAAFPAAPTFAPQLPVDYLQPAPQAQYAYPPRRQPAFSFQSPQVAVGGGGVFSFRQSPPAEEYDGEDNDDDEDNEEDEEDEDEERGYAKGKAKEGKRDKGRLGGPRAPGACDPCKQSKVKCVFPTPGAKCRRCAQGGHECRVSGRKQKPRPPSHAELVRRVQEKDRVILSLLVPHGQGAGTGLDPEIVSRMGLADEANNTAGGNKSTLRRDTGSSTSAPSPAASSPPAQPQSLSPQPATVATTLSHSATAPTTPNHAHTTPSTITNTTPNNPTTTTTPLPLPTLPIWDKRTPKREVERRVEAWIGEARGRIMRWGGGAGAGEGWSEGSGSGAGGGAGAGGEKEEIPHPRRWTFPDADPGAGAEVGVPDILTSGLVSEEEVGALFELFFKMNDLFFSVCDRAMHTPQRVLRSSPFLYTTICAVASRHYTPRPTLYPQLLDAAKRAAGAALNAPKSVETCQAYLLLGVYGPPSRTFREDRAFLYYGLAIRIGTDLELHLPPKTPHPHTLSPPSTSTPPSLSPLSPSTPTPERTLINRARVWLNCFCTDRSISTQLGKPSAIVMPGDTALPFDLKAWWRSSRYNLPQDFHMCAYASLLLVMSGFHDVVYSDAYGVDGVKKILDLNIVQSYADRVTAVGEEWQMLVKENFPGERDSVLTWRDNLWPFLVSYAKLVVLSIGLRDGMRQGLKQPHTNPFADQCVTAATDIVTQVVDKLAKLGYLRYSVEAYFVFMGFAAAFLLKILRPKFAFMLRPGQAHAIIQLVQRLIDFLGSDDVAINNRHTPKLYSRFLADVLANQKRAMTTRASNSGTPRDTSPVRPPHAAPSPGSVFPAHPQTQTQPQMQQPAWSFGVYPEQSPYMDVDRPLPGPPEDMMLASMAAITDPGFWEHGAMPGFAWTTNPGAWPMAVDAAPGTPGGVSYESRGEGGSVGEGAGGYALI